MYIFASGTGSGRRVGLSLAGGVYIAGGTTPDEVGCCCILDCGSCDSSAQEGEPAYHVTGGLFAGDAPVGGLAGGWADRPFADTNKNWLDDPVGTGSYNRAEISVLFAKALRTTFDGIAIKDGFAACIFEREDFEGEPYAVLKGPKIVNNTIYRGNRTWNRAGLDGSPNAIIPVYWSLNHMWSPPSPWSNPGSIKICRTTGGEVYQYGFQDIDGRSYTAESPLIQ